MFRIFLLLVSVEKLDLVDPFGLMFVLLLPRLLRKNCCWCDWDPCINPWCVPITALGLLPLFCFAIINYYSNQKSSRFVLFWVDSMFNLYHACLQLIFISIWYLDILDSVRNRAISQFVDIDTFYFWKSQWIAELTVNLYHFTLAPHRFTL